MNMGVMRPVSKLHEVTYQSALIRCLTTRPGILINDRDDTMRERLIPFLQEAFQISNDDHEEYLRIARVGSSLSTNIYLNCKILDIKHVATDDASTDHDATCFQWHLQSRSQENKEKSKLKYPVTIPAPKAYQNECLVVEMLKKDYETVTSDKKNVKSPKKHKVIGDVVIPLNTIPADGIEMWYNLTSNKHKESRKAMILLKLNFSIEKRSAFLLEEYRHLLSTLLRHELERSGVARFWWSGQFSNLAEAALVQQSSLSGLTPFDIQLAKYCVYCEKHDKHELSLTLFCSLLRELLTLIQCDEVSIDDVQSFWDATSVMLPSCFLTLEKFMQKDRSISIKSLSDALNIIVVIKKLQDKLPKEFNLFPSAKYSWLKQNANSNSSGWSLANVLDDSVYTGAINWLQTICIATFKLEDTSTEKLRKLISIVELVENEIRYVLQHQHTHFKELDYPLANQLFKFYEVELVHLIEPIVHNICKKMKRISLPHITLNDNDQTEEEDDTDEESNTLLLQLYSKIRNFVALSKEVCAKYDCLKIASYHKWFTNAITHSLDKLLDNVLRKMSKIFEQDTLAVDTRTLSFTSSAFDTCCIIQGFSAFWLQLDGTDAEESYIIVSKIIDDIMTCFVYYVDELIKRVTPLTNNSNLVEKYCVVINNIEYVKRQILPSTHNLGTAEIIKKLYRIRDARNVRRCSETFACVTANAIEIKTTRISELTTTLADKIMANFSTLLIQETGALTLDTERMEDLLKYLDETHEMLFRLLNDVNCNAVVDRLWQQILGCLLDYVQVNVEKLKPHSFFIVLRNTFQVMLHEIFAERNKSMPKIHYQNDIDAMENLLRLNSYTTTELIHQYYLFKHREQQQNSDDIEYGELAVKCFFQDDELKLNVLNARKLIPLDNSNESSCNPFVRISFIGPNGNEGMKELNTDTCYKTNHPLFSKYIDPIIFSPELRNMTNALIILTIKNRQMFGLFKYYMSEAIIRVGDIIDAEDKEFEQNGRTFLPLARAKYASNEYLKTLERRTNDKMAKKFVRRLKKLSNISVKNRKLKVIDEVTESII